MTIAKRHDDDSGDNGREDMIVLNATWTVLFKAGLALVPVIIALGVWIVTQIFGHESRLTLLEYRANHRDGGTNTNTVSIGKGTADSETHRGYLTTEEVAQKEKVTARTVLNWIEEGKIDPPPTKEGKAWTISENYRLLPKPAEPFGSVEPCPPAKP